ncbi:sensor domain-containing protein [Streptomyces durbertensis]|uniref:Sensor domain-containing protein n=1 Tax=Streptomyces durbertensis TaxID=2448886 RepID=A0ABR6EDD7_9ACTN|nr:sensor domain-containing protein [Streptomyces durbertensis]MBB1242519.1 sensor domain-containing protein [Streptomyces durbertensis]
MAETTALVGTAPHVRTRADSPPGRFWRDVAYLLAGLPIGVVAFVLAVTGFTLGVGTVVVWIGLPVLVGTLVVARWFAATERWRVASTTGRPLPAPVYRRVAGDGPARHLRVLLDPQAWRDLLHMVLAFPLRVVGFVVATVWTIGGFGGLTYALWSWSLPRGEDNVGLAELMFGTSSRLADVGVHTGIGVVLLLTAVPALRALTATQAGLARLLLTAPGAGPTSSAR